MSQDSESAHILEKETPVNEVKSQLLNARERRRQLLQKRSVPAGHDGTARHYSKLVWRLIIPISVCMLTVVWSVKNLSPIFLGDLDASGIPMVINENQQPTVASKLESAVVNAIVIVVVIALMTFVVLFLYRYRYMKILSGWLILSVMISLLFQSWLWVDSFCVRFQIPYDYVTIGFALWNFSVVGVLAIFYYAHPLWRQSYLVTISVLIGWILTNTPKWTTWCLLAAVSIYDIIAVLCPKGPLALLLKEAEKSEEAIPGLVYVSQSSKMTKLEEETSLGRNAHLGNTNESNLNVDNVQVQSFTPVSETSVNAVERTEEHHSSADASEVNGDQPLVTNGVNQSVSRENQQAQAEQFEYETDSFMLGLGDFIFYSLLVGCAAKDSYLSWVICYIAIIFGFCTTLLCLAITQRALPALPCSIFYGIIFYFISQYVIYPYEMMMSDYGLYL